MTIDKMWEIQARLISLECALTYYNKKSEIEVLDGLMKRLMLRFDTDESIERDCEIFISSFDELMKQFDHDVL